VITVLNIRVPLQVGISLDQLSYRQLLKYNWME